MSQQRAALSEEQIIAIRKGLRVGDLTKPWADSIAFARAIEQAAYAAGARDMRDDAERFIWWFSDAEKGTYINDYLQGIREHWTLDQWRASIDAARGK